MHVVLGANGAIGQNVCLELHRRQIPSRAVARTPRPNYIQADIANAQQALHACEGASHIYLCAGLPYSLAVWRRDWPRIMDNVIAAAEAQRARVIFIDNMYMYGPAPLQVPITEEHPQDPPSKKGAVRKQIAVTLLTAHRSGRVKALIARAPDFYGPGAANSLIYQLLLSKMLAGQRPSWLGDPKLRHSFGHVGDIARAMVTLALDDGAYGKVWHTPTRREPITITQVHAMLAAELGGGLRVRVVPRWTLHMLKWFVPILREIEEMAYQCDSDYVFSSAEFEARYPDFAITPYEEGIREMVASLRPRATS